MATRVEKTIEVDVPVRTAYNQWTQFEQFPQFMGGVQQVRQLSESMLHWVAEIAGVKREWDAAILEQVPDQKVAWAATSGATNAGAVYFQPLGADRAIVRLTLEYQPEGLVEQVGDFLNVVERRAEADLEKFKQFIESQGAETGGWRGSVNEPGTIGTPGVEAASASQGDSGKAGVSGTAVAAGAAAVAGVAGVAAAVTASGRGSEQRGEHAAVDELAGDPVAVEPTATTGGSLGAGETIPTPPLGEAGAGSGGAASTTAAGTGDLPDAPLGGRDPLIGQTEPVDPEDPRSGTLDDPGNPERRI